MKRKMRNRILTSICYLIFIILLGGCSFFQKKDSIPSVEEVYNSILLDDKYRLNRYLMGGFPLDYQDSNGKSLLITALENNSLNSITLLLNRNIDLDKVDNSMTAPIFYVRSLEALKLLCENNVDLNVVDNQKAPLFINFVKNKPLLYSEYLTTQKINFQMQDKNGWNSLFWSGVSGNSNLIRKMIQEKVNFLEIDNKGNYPIYYVYDQDILLEMLSIKGYDFKKKNLNNELIMGEVYLRAVANGYIDVVKKLLEMGVNPYYTSYGENAIKIAKDNENVKMIKFLNDNDIK